jgi:hypothetical protein
LAAFPSIPSIWLRISIARPFEAPESSTKTIDGWLPEDAPCRPSRREIPAPATPN